MVIRYLGAFFAPVMLFVACGEPVLQAISPCGDSSAKVTRILDGDTVELEDGTKIRYLHVDTPELAQGSNDEHECLADEARLLNEALVLGKTVSLEYDLNCSDGYGRTLAFVSVGNRSVNETLLERGYAEILIRDPNVTREAAYRELEAAAQEVKAGIWGACQ